MRKLISITILIVLVLFLFNTISNAGTNRQDYIIDHINDLTLANYYDIPWEASVTSDGQLKVVLYSEFDVVATIYDFEEYLDDNMTKRSKRRILKDISKHFSGILVMSSQVVSPASYNRRIAKQYGYS